MYLVFGFSNAHCIAVANNKKDMGLRFVDSGDGKHKVNETWQKNFTNQMINTKDVEEAWGLFHAGGITGAGSGGQVFVIRDKTQTKLYFVEQSSNKIDMEKALTGPKLQTFNDTLAPLTAHLEDHWEIGFDMFETEFLHVVRTGDDLVVKQRVKWRFGRGKCVEHCAVAKLFQDLVNSQK